MAPESAAASLAVRASSPTSVRVPFEASRVGWHRCSARRSQPQQRCKESNAITTTLTLLSECGKTDSDLLRPEWSDCCRLASSRPHPACSAAASTRLAPPKPARNAPLLRINISITNYFGPKCKCPAGTDGPQPYLLSTGSWYHADADPQQSYEPQTKTFLRRSPRLSLTIA
jgi:hypothetical protein